MFNLTSVTSTAVAASINEDETKFQIKENTTLEFEIIFRSLGDVVVPKNQKAKQCGVGGCGYMLKRSNGDGFISFKPFRRDKGEQTAQGGYYYKLVTSAPDANTLAQATAVATSLKVSLEEVLKQMQPKKLVRVPLSIEQIWAVFEEDIPNMELCEPELQVSVDEEMISEMAKGGLCVIVRFNVDKMRYVKEEAHDSKNGIRHITKYYNLDDDAEVVESPKVFGTPKDLTKGLAKAKTIKPKEKNSKDDETVRHYLLKFESGYPDGWGDGKHIIHFKMLSEFKEHEKYESIINTAVVVLLKLANDPRHRGIKSEDGLKRRLSEVGLDLNLEEWKEADTFPQNNEPQEDGIIDM